MGEQLVNRFKYVVSTWFRKSAQMSALFSKLVHLICTLETGDVEDGGIEG